MKIQNFTLLLSLFSQIILAQEKDSVKTYQLDEITVKSGIVLEPEKTTRIRLKEVEQADAIALSDLGKYIPSLKVQTNSRGETLFYLRGSNTRQIALYFDGVPLNIPWDNRIDLSQIPTEAIEEISVIKGIPSIVFGANTPAGVINVSSKEYSGGNKGGITLQFGENKFRKYAGSWVGGGENFSFLASLSYNKADGYNLPFSYYNGADITRERINSDRENLNAFIKLKYKFGQLTNTGVTFSYNVSKKGVPPEMDAESPRFWRYPFRRKFSTGINGSYAINNTASSILSYSFSASAFDMEINQYKDISYSAIDDIEKDKDRVIFGRLIYTQLFGSHSIIKLSASGFASSHKESFLSDNYRQLEYTQNVFSAGGEYEYIDKKYKLSAGATIDGSAEPLTGDKPSKPSNVDYSYNLDFVYSLTSDLSGQFSFGRKLRFPTPRESFGGALGRFVPNPELGPELTFSGEIGLSYRKNFGEITASLFSSLLNNGIVRAVIRTPSGKKFQRINKDRIRNTGIELSAEGKLRENFSFQFNFTYMTSKAGNEAGEFADTLEYKPNFIGGLNFSYYSDFGLNAVVENYFVGGEFGLREGSDYFRKLPAYFLSNLRLSYKFNLKNSSDIEVFIRVNNLFDKLYYTQWSLPEAGRQFWIGVITNF